VFTIKQILEVCQLTKQYKNQRGIFNIHFSIQQGEIFGLFGPNGAGKSTLLKIITGLSKADHGEVKILGYGMEKQFEQAMSQVGCIIESGTAYEHMSAIQNLQIIARFHPEISLNRMEETLKLVGLFEVRKEKVRNFSSGMKQRMALALALLSNPAFVILDEPTTSLDIEGIIDFRNIILRLATELNISFLISSHSIHEMEQICNRFGIISNGRLVKEGLMTQLLPEKQTLEEFYLSVVKEDVI
jgi:ABC-2 type transport system ATP-binding protein